MGIWFAEAEVVTFRLIYLTELQNRGVEQFLIACVDGLSGFPEAYIQRSNIHMVRNSLKYVPWKNYKAITAGLKKIHQSTTEQEASAELEDFAAT